MRSRGLVAIGAGLATLGAAGWMRVSQVDSSWTREFTLEQGEHAWGVGLIQDGSLKLVSHGTPRRD